MRSRQKPHSARPAADPHPSNLDAFPKKDTLPVVVWGNGGCAIDSKGFMGFLTTVASHGFLVIGTAAIEGAERRQADVEDLRTAIDWADKEGSATARRSRARSRSTRWP